MEEYDIRGMPEPPVCQFLEEGIKCLSGIHRVKNNAFCPCYTTNSLVYVRVCSAVARPHIPVKNVDGLICQLLVVSPCPALDIPADLVLEPGFILAHIECHDICIEFMQGITDNQPTHGSAGPCG